MQNKELKKRIIDISYRHKLSHLGSCLTAVDIIDEIFAIKKSDEKFVLSSGHAGLALYCVIEKYTDYYKDIHAPTAEDIFEHHGVHPDRCNQCHIDCSTGSLGQGLPISCGMALGNREANVYCLVSDGEMSEGSIWEALQIKRTQRLNNLHIYCNFNGWGAYRQINWSELLDYKHFGIKFVFADLQQLPFLKGQDAHYKVMNEEEYRQAMEILR